MLISRLAIESRRLTVFHLMDGKWIMVDVVNSRVSFLFFFFFLEQEKLEFELVEMKRALFNGTIILLEHWIGLKFSEER